MAVRITNEEILSALTKETGTDIALVKYWNCDNDTQFYSKITNEETFVADILATYMVPYFEISENRLSVVVKKDDQEECTDSSFYHYAIIASRIGGIVKLAQHHFIEFTDESMNISYDTEKFSCGVHISLEHQKMVTLALHLINTLYSQKSTTV